VQKLDTERIDDTITAYLLVGTQIGKENETVAKLRAVANVTGAYLLFGEYDILVEMECVNLSALDATIAATKKVDHVTRVMQLIAAKQC
jgi:anthranilate phosphoribosyltransferase